MTLPKSKDLELEQCYARFVVAGIVLFWGLYWHTFNEMQTPTSAFFIQTGFVIFAVVHWLHVKHFPGYNPIRRTITLFVDHGATLGLMMATGEMAIFFLFVNLFITLGTGFRYGVTWMGASVLISSLGILALPMGEYWKLHPIFIASLLILNLIIPAYVSMLIKTLEASRKQLAEYAETMETMALKDSLTGLPNRYALHDDLAKSCAIAHRHKFSIAVFYFDLDGFKKVNDTYGHAAGDQLLKETAIRVKQALRTEDTLMRLGGDEFVAILHMNDAQHCNNLTPNKANEYAETLGNRILESIISIKEINGNPITISASLGGVIVDGDTSISFNPEQLVQSADENMYVAKNSGKNRIALTYLATKRN